MAGKAAGRKDCLDRQFCGEFYMQVSVIIPTYNARQWIGETLRSVESQLTPSMEVIVVDDGSVDDTAAIVERDFTFATVIRQQNQGVSFARSAGLAAASGSFVKYLDSDDLLTANSIRQQLTTAENAQADVVYGNWSKLGQDADNEWRVFETVTRRIEDVHPDPEIAFFTTMWCTTGAYLWRREFLVTQHPGWHPRLPVIQDARYALDAALHGAKFVYDNNIAAIYRCHRSNSVSTRSQHAFNCDCLLSGKEVHAIWKERDGLNADRRRALLDFCENFGLWSYEFSPQLSAEFFDFARQIDPRWRPQQTALRRCIATVAGARNLARFRSWTVALRNRLPQRASAI